MRKNSKLQLSSNVGCGVKAKGLSLLQGSEIVANGALGAISIAGDDLLLDEATTLIATTDENYNALKCEGNPSNAQRCDATCNQQR